MKLMNGMFYSCHNLLSLDLSNLDTRSAIDMSSMFFDCHKLKYINLSNFDTKNVEMVFMMFYGCINLEFLNITNFVFNKMIYYHRMFDNDAKLHLIITSDFYDGIIDQNEYLKVIADNVTIINSTIY